MDGTMAVGMISFIATAVGGYDKIKIASMITLGMYNNKAEVHVRCVI